MISAQSAALLARLAGEDRIGGISVLLARNGIVDLVAGELLAGGENNRVIRLTSSSRPSRVLAAISRTACAQRERLAHGYSFASFAWKQGRRALPEPVDAKPEQQCTLFEFVSGGKPPYPPTLKMMSEAMT